MSLREIANADLKEIVNDPETGGDECTITSPAGGQETFSVLNNDIELSIDPDTGQMVTGRQATIAVLINELVTAGFDKIRGIADSSGKPWLVDIGDVKGVAGKFKVIQNIPDSTIGLMVLILESYK